jgi:hypothetical protein
LIIYCEIHRKQFLGSPAKQALGASFPTCCEHLFNPSPIFTYSGTCFTTKMFVEEDLASIFNSMQEPIKKNFFFFFAPKSLA